MSHPTSEITEHWKLSTVKNSTSKLDTQKIYKSLNEWHTCAHGLLIKERLMLH